MGIGEENDRPDISKVILDYICHSENLLGEVMQMWEVSEGALDKAFLCRTTREILSCGIWVLHIPLRGGKKLLQPPNKIVTQDIGDALLREDFILVVPG